jgi:NAD(P)-dependent dehydrogenase (short-subunit alcohol dehydrogenase family)
MQVQGQIAFVPGAGRGIGRAVCRELRARGAAGVVVADLDGALAQATAAELGGLGVQCDVSSEAAVQAAVAAAQSHYGRVDILVSNAGFGVKELDLDDALSESNAVWQRMWDVHVMAHVYAARAVLPGMLERGEGHFVYVSSLAGKAPSPRSAMYNASKFGLRGFTLAFRQDLHGTGVGASLVLPGFIRDAGMFADAEMSAPPGMGTSTPEAVADAVVRAIEADKAEIVVAPPQQRAISALGSTFPSLAAVVQRGRGERIAEELAAKQSSKR